VFSTSLRKLLFFLFLLIGAFFPGGRRAPVALLPVRAIGAMLALRALVGVSTSFSAFGALLAPPGVLFLSLLIHRNLLKCGEVPRAKGVPRLAPCVLGIVRWVGLDTQALSTKASPVTAVRPFRWCWRLALSLHGPRSPNGGRRRFWSPRRRRTGMRRRSR